MNEELEKHHDGISAQVKQEMHQLVLQQSMSDSPL